jgi:hypothetical protein
LFSHVELHVETGGLADLVDDLPELHVELPSARPHDLPEGA